MNLPKKTRKALYEAQQKGKPLELQWPADGPILERGVKYPVYSEKGERVFSIRVEDFRPYRKGKRATVVIDAHATRILPGLKYEPERVSADYEKRLALEATQRCTVLRAEGTGKGKLAKEYAARQAKRLETT